MYVKCRRSSFLLSHLQPNFNGSNTFGTMKICSRQFGLVSVNHRIRTEGKVEVSFLFIYFKMSVYCVFSLELPHRCDSNENTKYTVSI